MWSWMWLLDVAVVSLLLECVCVRAPQPWYRGGDLIAE